MPAPNPLSIRLAAALALAALAGCATRSADVKPAPVTAASFAGWDCAQLQDEHDRVRRRAADVAWAVDERAGNNILALGVGVTIFWPALLAMRPDGPEARELAELKGRDEALGAAAAARGCPPAPSEMAPALAATLPVHAGDRLVYADRHGARGPVEERVVEIAALRRDGIEFAAAGGRLHWRQDLAGNLAGAAPEGMLHWRRLLPQTLKLGDVVAGDFVLGGEPALRARARGQVVAVGPQQIAGRSFDVAVVELFGDVVRDERPARVDGVLAVDRASGVLLRLELRSSEPEFALRRRLERVLPAS